MKRLVRTHSNCAYIAITSLHYMHLFYRPTPYIRIKLMSASLFIQYQFH